MGGYYLNGFVVGVRGMAWIDLAEDRDT